MSSYSSSSFNVNIENNSDVSGSVKACTLTRTGQYNRLVSSLLIEIEATDEVLEWVKNIDYFAEHYISYSVKGSEFGIGDTFAIKKIEMKSDKDDSESLIVVVLAESMLRSVPILR